MFDTSENQGQPRLNGLSWRKIFTIIRPLFSVVAPLVSSSCKLSKDPPHVKRGSLHSKREASARDKVDPTYQIFPKGGGISTDFSRKKSVSIALCLPVEHETGGGGGEGKWTSSEGIDAESSIL